jgi:uncharacterized protein (TIGR02145 family)
MKKIVLLLAMGMLLFSCRPEDNPSVSTGEVTNITATTASSAGNVTADGGAAIIARGVCWSTTQFPSISDSKTSNGTGLGGFTSNITGLSPNTTYYVRAYATNSVGTAYGEQKSFTTNQEMPTVVTGEITNITATSATCSGNVTSDGGLSVTTRGVCWSTSENHTTSNSKTTDGTGLGTFTSNINDLSPNTTYYVRTYATNAKGTAYGEQKSFTTDQEMPTVVTGDVTNITYTTADYSGNVTADGGASVTARGVCWSTSENPTTSNSKTTDGTGLGTYTSTITDLFPSTTYYVRAYATNSVGTAYGEQRTFTTNALTLPSAATEDVTNITTTTATCLGNVTSDGGSSVTARGVCWSTSDNPTTSNTKTTDGTGIGAYSSNLTGLSQNTTYYFKAYATNSKGTAYGEQRTFTTLPVSDIEYGSFTDSRDDNQYVTVTIGSQVWMAENLAYLPSVSPPTSGSNNLPYYYVYGYDGTNVSEAKATSNYQTYGVLYNWRAAMNGASSSNTNPSGVQGICPEGWHLPSEAEWTILTDYLGGEDVAHGKMKETGTTHWKAPNTGATNESGFTAVPGGFRYPDGTFNYLGLYCYWWSSTTYKYDSSSAYDLSLSSTLYSTFSSKAFGSSVRCVRDPD